MNESPRTEWLKSLKPGDVVCVVGSTTYGNRPTYTQVAVKKVLPSGKIRLADDTLFNTLGVQRVGESFDVGTRSLRPWDDEVVAIVAHEKLVTSVMHYANIQFVDIKKVEAQTDTFLVALRDALRLIKKDMKTEKA